MNSHRGVSRGGGGGAWGHFPQSMDSEKKCNRIIAKNPPEKKKKSEFLEPR